MISSASAQIEAIGGAHLKKTVMRNGKAVVIPDYATVQGILLGAIATFVIFITIIGPEYVSPPTLTRLVFGNTVLISVSGITGRTSSSSRLHSRVVRQLLGRFRKGRTQRRSVRSSEVSYFFTLCSLTKSSRVSMTPRDVRYNYFLSLIGSDTKCKEAVLPVVGPQIILFLFAKPVLQIFSSSLVFINP